TVFTVAILAQLGTATVTDTCACGGLVPVDSPDRVHLAMNAALFASALSLSLSDKTYLAWSPPGLGGWQGSNLGFDNSSLLLAFASLALLLWLRAVAAVTGFRQLRLNGLRPDLPVS